MRVKKIIALEGIIIISVLICSAVLFFLAGYFENKKYSVEDYGTLYGLKFLIEDTGERYTLRIPAINRTALNERMNDAFKQVHGRASMDQARYVQNYIDNKYMNEIKAIKGRKKYEMMSNFCFAASPIILFVIYPAYLMIRFIFWAIKTLMTKETPQSS